HRDLVKRFPERFYADAGPAVREALAQCVSPLVLEAEGEVVPIGYGFGRQYAIGSVAGTRLRELAPPLIPESYPRFRQLCAGVYAEAPRPSALPFLNWYEMLQSRSLDHASLVVPH